jgi:predicted anti-sigma-YlaC factor YlaD
MNECERVEMELSAVADGAGDPAAWLGVLDHLAVCSSCRDFFRQVRALDSLAGAVIPPAVLPPPEVWARIETESGLAPVLPLTRRVVARWALRGAATGVVALGLWAAGMLRLPSVLTVRDGMEITLGQSSGRMTDAQFVELAVSVVKADRKYREKMLEILTAVNTAAPSEEDRRGPQRLAAVGGDHQGEGAQRDLRRSPSQYY